MTRSAAGRPLKTAELPTALLVDMLCDRCCQVELDLSAVSTGVSLRQLIEAARLAHNEAHAAEPRRVHRIDATTLVRCRAGGRP